MKVIFLLSLYVCFFLGGGQYSYVHEIDKGKVLVLVKDKVHFIRCYGKEKWIVVSPRKGILMMNFPKDSNYRGSAKFEYKGYLVTYSPVWDILDIRTPGYISICGSPIDVIFSPQ